MKSKTTAILIIAALGIGGYVLWKRSRGEDIVLPLAGTGGNGGGSSGGGNDTTPIYYLSDAIDKQVNSEQKETKKKEEKSKAPDEIWLDKFKNKSSGDSSSKKSNKKSGGSSSKVKHSSPVKTDIFKKTSKDSPERFVVNPKGGVLDTHAQQSISKEEAAIRKFNPSIKKEAAYSTKWVSNLKKSVKKSDDSDDDKGGKSSALDRVKSFSSRVAGLFD